MRAPPPGRFRALSVGLGDAQTLCNLCFVQTPFQGSPRLIAGRSLVPVHRRRIGLFDHSALSHDCIDQRLRRDIEYWIPRLHVDDSSP